jgi:type I restriction enzyme, S subunit
VKLRRAVQLVTTCIDEERPAVALENVESGTGHLIGMQLAIKRGTEPGLASVEPGDVLFGKLRPYLAKTWLASFPTHASTELLCFRPKIGVESRWLRYLVASGPFMGWATATSDGTKMPRTSWEKVRDFEFVLPSNRQQRGIADFLDAETARIDALVGLRRVQLDLLTEKVQSRLLTLLGDWRTDSMLSLRKLRTSVFTGPFGTQLAASEYVTGGVPIVNPTHIVNGVIIPSEHESVSQSVANRLERHRLRRGDLVAGRKGDLGRSALVGENSNGWVCGSDSIVIRTKQECLLPEFLAVVLQSGYFRQQLLARSTAATMPSLNEDSLLQFLVPGLGTSAQEDIVHGWNFFNETQLNLRERVKQQMILLHERKQALITAAVTGQLNLARGIAEEAS